jgi:hypothetical protein
MLKWGEQKLLTLRREESGLARYIGVLYLTNQFSAAQYASEVEILLTFLRPALRP